MIERMKLISLSFFMISLGLISCNNNQNEYHMNRQNNHTNLIQYVNPFIGTKNMGHTYPGATTPFGMVQLSPETHIQPFYKNGQYNQATYRYCSGYQYEDSTLFGFAHTHFSGTGHSDLGDFLIMPTTGNLQLNPGSAGEQDGFHSNFNHENEFAEPGYYRVRLDKYNIQAELTTSDRVGFHQYTYPESENAHIILDLVYNIYHHVDKNVWTFIRVENDSLVTGYRQTTGWARNRIVYFAMQFSKSFENYGHQKYDNTRYNGFYRKFQENENFPEIAGRNIRVYFNFKTKNEEVIKVKFALSSVSTEGALKNMETEIPHWDFAEVKRANQAKWNSELSRIIVETLAEKDKETFYTALYHTMLSPILYEDVDGQYRGLDQNIHKSEGFTNYTIFSLWDTYRALHPLFNIIQPERSNDMIKSMLAHYEQSVHKMLPIWSHYANENWCMIGYHAASVIADAVVKNVGNFNKRNALKACVSTSTKAYYDGLGEYLNYHYVPEDKNPYSVSKTLEYAYNDWCIAQMAQNIGDEKTRNEYLKRSEYYQNVYDPRIGFMRPKLASGEWKMPFNSMDTHGQGFIEGNAWNYSLYVPHQIDKMIDLMGGKDRFIEHLDSLFTMEIADQYIEKNEDITRDGIIGNYVHGNEPGHHIPYLYNWTRYPWKTQERVRMIMETMYGNQADGLCGNDDAGQMSAWYIFSAMGFYPVCPGSDQYHFGSPNIKKGTVHLLNRKIFSIQALDLTRKNIYIQSIKLNGKPYEKDYITHEDIIKGGTLVYQMGSKPNMNLWQIRTE